MSGSQAQHMNWFVDMVPHNFISNSKLFWEPDYWMYSSKGYLEWLNYNEGQIGERKREKWVKSFAGLLPPRGRLRGVGPGTSTPVQLTPWCAADGPDMGKYWGLELALSKNTEVGYYLLFTASAVSGGRWEVVSRAVGRRWFRSSGEITPPAAQRLVDLVRWAAGEARRELTLGSWAVAKNRACLSIYVTLRYPW